MLLNKNLGISLVIVEHRVMECLKISSHFIGMKMGEVFGKINVVSNFDHKEISSVFV